jgi:hypothetical protein
MSHLENAYHVTAAMLARRNELKALNGVTYYAKVKPWKDVLRKMMSDGQSVIGACASAARKHQDDGMAVAWLAAAAVEICKEDKKQMGKKKTPEQIKADQEERDKREMIQMDFATLKQKVAELKKNREIVSMAMVSPAIATILSQFDRQIEATKEQLVSADKKEIDSLQAQVVARRCLLDVLNNAYLKDLEEATRQLREFETKNSLFLQASNAQEETDTEAEEQKATA